MKKTTNKSAPARASSPCTQTVEDSIRTRIFTIRGVQVMLSPDLAALYDVEVKYLHRQVKRNASRFPLDFVMHLSPDEAKSLRCQNVTSKRGGDRYGLWAFTEQGIAMLSSVLKSDRAAEVNVAIMRAFVLNRPRSTGAPANTSLRPLEDKRPYQNEEKRGDKPPTFPPPETLRLCVSALKYNRVGDRPRVPQGAKVIF